MSQAWMCACVLQLRTFPLIAFNDEHAIWHQSTKGTAKHLADTKQFGLAKNVACNLCFCSHDKWGGKGVETEYLAEFFLALVEEVGQGGFWWCMLSHQLQTCGGGGGGIVLFRDDPAAGLIAYGRD